MSTLAVVLVLTTGTAYAAGLAANSVRSIHIVNGAVRGPDLATASVGGRQLLDDSVGNADLAPDSVGKSALKSNTVDTYGLQDGQVRNPDIASGAVTSNKLHADVLADLQGGGVVPTTVARATSRSATDRGPGGAVLGRPDHRHLEPAARRRGRRHRHAHVSYPSSCSATRRRPDGGST